jgi:type II secretion system protein G
MFSTLKTRRGFTLIELMIVIIVIAILALIVIPKLASASRKAKESTMRANLNMVRNALEQFQSDTGYYPNELEDLIKSTGSKGYDGSATVDVATTYKGPYMRQQGGIGTNNGIPKNPFITSAAAETPGTAAPASATTPSTAAHWVYDKAAGKIWPNVLGSTVDDAQAYSSL